MQEYLVEIIHIDLTDDHHKGPGHRTVTDNRTFAAGGHVTYKLWEKYDEICNIVNKE